jgi:hypothetical protein
MDRSGNKQQTDDNRVLGLLQHVDMDDNVGVSEEHIFSIFRIEK